MVKKKLETARDYTVDEFPGKDINLKHDKINSD